MSSSSPLRPSGIALVLIIAVGWSIVSAAEDERFEYPNGHLLTTAEWLEAHAKDTDLVIVDVRNDEHFGGEVIPDAIRMPWGQFRTTDPIAGVAGIFVGVNRAQELLGEHGLQRTDRIVLYDSVERDGGATASYVFWLLELLGHERVSILDGGIDAWKRAGLETSNEPAKLKPVLYQAPPENLRGNVRIRGNELQQRLGDRYYQILDVRSGDEYLGEAPNADWQGRALKLGHVPGAYNVNYIDNRVDEETKLVKPYSELQRMYAGLNPERAVVTYCHSARRSSYSYFILRLMGFSDVRLYDYSWNEWGKKSQFFPVETKQNILTGPLPGDASMVNTSTRERQSPPKRDGGQGGGKSGYISCGA